MKGLDQQMASNWPFITVSMKMCSSVQCLAAEELVSRLPSFDIFYQDDCNLLAGCVCVRRDVCE